MEKLFPLILNFDNFAHRAKLLNMLLGKFLIEANDFRGKSVLFIIEKDSSNA